MALAARLYFGPKIDGPCSGEFFGNALLQGVFISGTA